MQPTKRIIRTVDAFIGKRVSAVHWVIPAGYATCAITGKLFPESELEITFQHYLFDKAFLTSNGIYCEDAAWLSAEGFDIIIDTLDRLGVLAAYKEALEHVQDFIDGRCKIGATGLTWSTPARQPIALRPALDRDYLLLTKQPRSVDPLIAAMERNTPRCRRCKVLHEHLINGLCSHCVDELAVGVQA